MSNDFDELKGGTVNNFRPISNLNSILGEKFKVLDEGFVRVVDYMGNDAAICQAARVSYGKGTKTIRDDRKLIRYLLAHRHTSPFEMCSIKLHVRVPMDTWRQWIRHRTAKINEYSTRYSEAIDANQRTKFAGWRKQSGVNKQGSGGYFSEAEGFDLSAQEAIFLDSSRKLYESRIARGVAREQARKDLPLSTYTEAYWKIDLHNLLHFLALRTTEHAQKEIREYAKVILGIAQLWVPDAVEAFEDYTVNKIEFSGPELMTIDIMKDGKSFNESAATADLTKREMTALSTKLQRIGLVAIPD